MSSATAPIVEVSQPSTGKSSPNKGKTPARTSTNNNAAALADATEKTTRQEQEKGETETLVNSLLVTEGQIITRTVASLIDYVMFIGDARAQLKGKSISHLQFDPWAEFQRRSKGGFTQISMCLSIAKRSALLDPENFAKLPVSLLALYYIATNMSGSEITARIKDGTINMDLTVEQTKTLVGKPTKTSKKVKAATKKAVAAAKKEAEAERLRLEVEAKRERQRQAGVSQSGKPSTENTTPAPAPGTRLADQTPAQVIAGVPKPEWMAYKYDLSHSSEMDNAAYRTDLTLLPTNDLDLFNAGYGAAQRELPKLPNGLVYVLVVAKASDVSPMVAAAV